jgi:quercetin dioxygenase-like cupin family protein
VSAAGAVGGSPLANPAKQSQADLLRHWPGAKCESGDGKAVESLRPGVRLAWLASNPLPQDFPYYSVVTFPDPDRISSVLRSSYRKLSKVDARNDSQLIFYDEVIPASTLVAYVNADHWALAVPVNRSHPVIGSLFTTQNAYPREALLEALLRFIEEDLSAQGQQAERPAESHSAFAAASGVTRAGGGADDRLPRIVPLTPMSGDVEILYGDPEKPGEPFAMRIRELPGTRIPLHSHPVDEHITVLEGTFYFSVGEDHDDAAATKLTAGGYAFAPAGSSMHGYSPDGAVVQVHGVGPFEIAWRGGLQTLDDPDAKDTFRYRKNASVLTSRGAGVIRQGYASGSIVQYEIDGADGVRYMADEADLRPRPD